MDKHSRNGNRFIDGKPIPHEFLEQIVPLRKMASNYSTFLVRKRGLELELFGSGTYLSVDSQPYILTAKHVAEEFKATDELCISLKSYDSTDYRPSEPVAIQMQHVVLRAPNAQGKFFELPLPDIALIELPKTMLGAIEAAMSTVSIDQLKRVTGHAFVRSLEECQGHEAKAGLFAFSGWQGELAAFQSSSDGEIRAYTFPGLVNIGATLVQMHESNGFDLLEFDLKRRDWDSSPNSYRGSSGGGLWFFPRSEEDGVDRFDPTKGILVGIIIAETSVKHRAEAIWAHGPRSTSELVQSLLV